MAESIFTSQTPAILNGNDGVAYTLGTEFSRSTDGTITHGRWYFPDPIPTGTTDFVLYPGAGGAALARASFVAPVAGAWNTVALSAPVAYTAGTPLIAAVRTSGMYVATASFFAADLVNGDITAPAATNGRLDTADQHPGNVSGNHACFFVDVVFAAAGGGTIVPVGQATGADAATPIGRSKTRTLGQVAEADIAQPIRSVKVRTLGQAAETSTAQPIGRAKSLALGQAATADTATALVRRKIRVIGQAMEASTATAVGRLKVRAVNQAAEVDSATPLVANRIVTPGALTVTGDRLRASVTGDRIRMGVT